MKKTALVTGANRGLGLEVSRQLIERGYQVIPAARNPDEAKEKLGVEGLALDVTDEQSVTRAAEIFRDRFGELDVLVNNAGISMDGFDGEVARRTLDVNFHGVVRVVHGFQPVLSAQPVLVMVSSGVGALGGFSTELKARLRDESLSEGTLVELMQQFVDDVQKGRHGDNGWPSSAYKVSKAGLNALTRVLAKQYPSARINAVCPGWVRTDMGGSGASRSVEEGASGIVWAAALDADGPSGSFFRDGEEISW